MFEIIKKIFSLSGKRINFLHNIDNKGWYEGHKTYMKGIKDEIDETQEEIKKNNSVYLEDELGDVFWDYLCLINSLEQEGLIKKEKVFERCLKKFSGRLLENGGDNGDWQEVKAKQKQELLKEHNLYYNK